MAKIIRYSLTYLGAIELEDDENLTNNQIMSLIAEAAYSNCRAEIDYANDIEYEITEKDYANDIEYEIVEE